MISTLKIILVNPQALEGLSGALLFLPANASAYDEVCLSLLNLN